MGPVQDSASSEFRLVVAVFELGRSTRPSATRHRPPVFREGRHASLEVRTGRKRREGTAVRETYHEELDSIGDGLVETAVDVTLVGRYYERFADHAVSVAQRIVYLVMGQYADELPADPAAPGGSA